MGIDYIMDNVLASMTHNGHISDTDFFKAVLLSLIDDYMEDMLACDPSYSDLIGRIEDMVYGSSCMFQG